MFALHVINNQFDQMYKEAVSRNRTEAQKHLSRVRDYFKIGKITSQINSLSKIHSFTVISALELSEQPVYAVSELLFSIENEIEALKDYNEILAQEIGDFLVKLRWIVENYQYLGTGIGGAFLLLGSEFDSSPSLPGQIWALFKLAHSVIMPVIVYSHVALGTYADISAVGQAQVEGTGIEETAPKLYHKVIEGEEITDK
jgi:hypothetical protein